jgi:hypothetical protein
MKRREVERGGLLICMILFETPQFSSSTQNVMNTLGLPKKEHADVF